jgi:hypothetical protein
VTNSSGCAHQVRPYSALVVIARTWLAAMALAASAFVAGDVRAASSAARLFCIHRNVNANVVCYDARLRKDGTIDTTRPLDAYWIMRAQKGQREELTPLERRLAYGFTVSGPVTKAGFDFVLRAEPKRKLQVRRVQGRISAITLVSGRRSRLTSLFVQVEKTWTGPKILYVLLRGVDLRTHERREERIRR